ncbi:MAG: hypothetical protein KKD90_02835, partial [Candidatus Omnitrophica bacterium]|nr:hypothetical protein [Candidatus Omnitrophota bacterium]
DIVSEEKRLGKKPGQDMSVGEMTLPLLNLLKSVPANEKERLKTLVSKGSLNAVRTRLVRSGAAEKTRQEVFSYMGLAKKNLSALPETVFKKSLVNLTDFIIEKNFNLKEEGV